MAGISVNKNLGVWSLFDDDGDVTGGNDVFDGPVAITAVVVLSANTAGGFIKLKDALSGVPGTSNYDFVLPFKGKGSNDVGVTAIAVAERSATASQFGPVEFLTGLSYFVSDTKGQSLGSNLTVPPDVYIIGHPIP